MSRPTEANQAEANPVDADQGENRQGEARQREARQPELSPRAGALVWRWFPARGLRDEDWAGRHRLLIGVLVASSLVLTVVGSVTGTLNGVWLATVALICACAVGAVVLPPRRLPSLCVALGLTVACAGLVVMTHGLTEAHFAFFVAVAALALYRDWAPFGVFLIATVAHHLVAGMLAPQASFGHPGDEHHVLFWALVHGAAVLMAAAWQVAAWRLAEAEELRADADLSASRAQFEVSFDETPIPMALLTPAGRLLRVNRAYRRWLGIPPIPADGLPLEELPITLMTPNAPIGAQPDPPTPIMDLLLAGTPGGVPIERILRHDDGRILHVEFHGAPVLDRQGEARLVVAHCLDVTRERQQQQELRRKVREDSLTGLLSRAAFESDLPELFAATDGPVSVIYIDVDRFKAVNDSYGHGAGDELLVVLARQLMAIAPAGSLVARLGGDEFAVAVPGELADGERVGRAIVDECRTPFPFGHGYLQATVSVGLSVTAGADAAEPAVMNADAAMYAAKQSGRNQLMTFDDRMRLANGRRIAAELLLREALNGDRGRNLPVWFQPIVSLDSRRVVGAEALVRLRTDDGDLVSPGVFIPVAEETGLVVQLGEHVLQTALAQLQRWGDRLPYVSVNVSPRQLSEEGFLEMLERRLQASGLTDRSRLVLEITETSLLNTNVDLTVLLNSIKAMGVRLALDDFGTGYSSLTWLKAVPADIVKLDRSFVAGLSHDNDKASIISAVLWLASSLRMSVVAEGVEDVEDWIALERAHCPAVQGYLFSRPVEAEDLDAYLAPAGASGAAAESGGVPRPRPAPVRDAGPAQVPDVDPSRDADPAHGGVPRAISSGSSGDDAPELDRLFGGKEADPEAIAAALGHGFDAGSA